MCIKHITLEYFISCPNPNQFSVRIPRGEGVDVALAENSPITKPCFVILTTERRKNLFCG